MAGLAGPGQLEAALTRNGGDHAHRQMLRFEHRALLDVNLDVT